MLKRTSGHSTTYLSILIRKSFGASIICFLSNLFSLGLLILSYVFQVSFNNHHYGIETCLMWLGGIFNYDDQKARDVSLYCRCYLSNIMPESVFHETMGQGITVFCFHCCCCFLLALLVLMLLLLCFLFYYGWYFSFLWNFI